MRWFIRFLLSSIGAKVLMALTGIALVGFLVAHLAGNLLVWAGPDAINEYARRLRDFLPVLWALRIGLLLSFVLHVVMAIRLTRLNRQAKPVSYAVKDPVDSSFASRSMMLSGLVVLSFILYHLAHLTFRWTHPEFQDLGDYEVYKMMILSFRSPYVSGFYSIGVILLMVHLNHGLSSMFQTLGINHPKYSPLIKTSCASLSALLAIGFLSIPVGIFLGILS